MYRLIIGHYFLHILKCVSYSDPGQFPIWPVCRCRMLKVKSGIYSNSDNQYALSEFRNAIICKVIEVWDDKISRSDILKIFNNLLNGLLIVCG